VRGPGLAVADNNRLDVLLLHVLSIEQFRAGGASFEALVHGPQPMAGSVESPTVGQATIPSTMTVP
jgi:hypothetical protein